MMEFVPYDHFKDIEFVTKVNACKATWINGNIQGQNKKELNFKKSSSITVVLKKPNDSGNITSKELNEIQINLIIIYLIIIKNVY